MTDEYKSPLKRALEKAQEVDVPAGINFLNQVSRNLHEHKCSECNATFDCIETVCDVVCIRCHERLIGG